MKYILTSEGTDTVISLSCSALKTSPSVRTTPPGVNLPLSTYVL